MERPIEPKHWPAWIAHATDVRIIALRDTPGRFADSCAGTSIHDRFHFGEILLHVAAMFGRVDAICFLLENGADREAENQAQWTPLIEAVDHGQVEAADFLIQRGARLEYRAVPNLTAEQITAQRDQYREMLRVSSLNEFPLISEALRDAAFVEEMLAQITNTLTAPRYERAIHHCHDLDTLKLLVGKYRCEVNVHDGAGYWPLKLFAESGDCAALQYLLDAGANPNFTSTGDIALHAGVHRGSSPCVRLLLQRGSNPNQQDVDGQTPLHAVKDIETLELLLQAGADPHIEDQIGSRPSAWVKDERLKARLVKAERERDHARRLGTA